MGLKLFLCSVPISLQGVIVLILNEIWFMIPSVDVLTCSDISLHWSFLTGRRRRTQSPEDPEVSAAGSGGAIGTRSRPPTSGERRGGELLQLGRRRKRCLAPWPSYAVEVGTEDPTLCCAWLSPGLARLVGSLYFF